MTDGLTIYVSDPDEAIDRLAQLDSASTPSGPAIADPFRRTAELVSLLDLRVAQMSARTRPGRLARLATGLRPGARASRGLAAGA